MGAEDILMITLDRGRSVSEAIRALTGALLVDEALAGVSAWIVRRPRADVGENVGHDGSGHGRAPASRVDGTGHGAVRGGGLGRGSWRPG